MTEQDIQDTITAILQKEGGYTHNPADKGGETNYGITQKTADMLGLGPVKLLTPTTATLGYRNLFDRWGIDTLPDKHVFNLVADSCINHGPQWGIRWLQTAIHATADGFIGPKTCAAILRVTDWPQVYAAILAYRTQFYGHIVHNTPSQSVFIEGWLIRAASFLSPWPYV